MHTPRTDSDSESAEDPLSVHQVRNFMENMQEDVDEAAELAHSIEHSLQEKIMSGKAHLRRASKDIASTVSHAIGGAKVVVNEAAEKAKDIRRGSSSRYSHDDDEEGRHGHRHHRHRHHLHRHGEDEEGFLSWMVGEVKHRFDEESWTSCLSFLTNWPNFLLPFFSYYGALFVLPTLLSQLFNVDRTRKLRADSEDHRHPHVMTGVLSRTTTSGLSYFVFKFALTYLLSQYALHHVHHGHHLGETTSRLAELAKDAAASAGFGSAGDHGQYHMLSACEFVAEVFRFVPASLNLATAGVGTVLALAETAVSRRR
ncbi:hypothetical protein EDD11_008438 [Mortierella claussenii]|nr:hypothetical protein EDD11_008438 [Mortierella claussenii]